MARGVPEYAKQEEVSNPLKSQLKFGGKEVTVWRGRDNLCAKCVRCVRKCTGVGRVINHARCYIFLAVG